MKKFLFTIPRYNDVRQSIFEREISPRNRAYAAKHGFKYVEINHDAALPQFRDHPSWYKMWVVRELIKNKKVVDNDIITVLDADMYVVKLQKEFIPAEGKSFTYAIDNGNTHCMGSFSIRINNWSKALIDNILDEDRYRKYIDKQTFHEPSNGMSSFWRSHYEQASWYSLAGIKRHSWESFFTLPNYGYHSAKDEDTVYTVKDLLSNVEVLPTVWNATHDFDSTDRFNIIKVPDKEIIIKHFAGQQHWNIDKWREFTEDED